MKSGSAPLLLVLFLAAPTCDPQPPPPPPPGDAYCIGTPPKGVIMSAVDGIAGFFSSIIHGDPSADRRATALVWITDPAEGARINKGTSDVVPTATGYCTGTVMSDSTVLTAAHCNGAQMDVVIDGQTIRVDDKLMHPDYVRFPNDDVLMLYVEQTLPGPYVSAIYDASMRTTCTGGLIAQGYGRSETPGIDLNETPYRVTRELTKTLVTTGEEDGRHCFGDSGSALYADTTDGLKIAGVCSTTYSQDCEIGGDYVRLAHYKQWIRDNTR